MKSPGLLGHLATRLTSQSENLATEALCYVLQTSAAATAGFTAMLRKAADIPEELRFDTQASSDADAGIPDIVGYDAGGGTRVLLEAKFWAGLTKNQPVTYLERLPAVGDGVEGLLLVVTPSLRVDLVWAELHERCLAAGLQLGGASGFGEFRWIHVGGRVLGIISWRVMLEHLQDAATAGDDLVARANLGQIAGLCELMDAEAFIPLGPEELSGALPRRLVQYDGILSKVVDRLISDGTAKSKAANGTGLGRSAGTMWWGRSFAISGVTCLLSIDAQLWGYRRYTPFWLRIGYLQPSRTDRVLDRLNELQTDAERVVIVGKGDIFVAIDTPTGVEEATVVESMVAQIVRIKDLLKPLDASGGPVMGAV
ncbi:hypothetical protein ABIA35_004462 [Catenulispora sp. MAP12-49]|uniref:hypothetical protein n=1 Tax=Catenulispora sp. MAP12-49 TaxID=3156302 RepID=UPI0035147E34